jgi:hypothetical protein
VDRTRTVTWRSGLTPFIHRLSSLPWTLNSSVEGWLRSGEGAPRG